MKLSLVIPAYTLNEELAGYLLDCITSYRAQVDELIVTEDGGMYLPELRDLVDTYIVNKTNVGFTANANRGWRTATGDFVAIVNSDTQLRRGELKDLCIPGKVTSPDILTQNWGGLAGPFWVTPKEVTAKRGYLDEAMRIYASDSDYYHRIKDIFEFVPTVSIFHHIAQTTTAAGVENKEHRDADQAIFDKKHNV